MKRHNKKIFYKFISFILFLTFMSIIITSVTLSFTSHSYFKKTISQDYKNIIRISSNEIRLFMDQAQNNLENLALLIASTKLNNWQKEIAITAFLHTNIHFTSIALLSTEGRKIVTTDQEHAALSNSDKENFKTVLAGQNIISDIILTEESLPIIKIGIPVLHLGEVTEILWAELSLKSVWDILEGISIGKTGQVYIVDSSGRYLAHRKIDRVIKAPSFEKSDVLKKINQLNTTIEWSDKNDNIRLYCVGTRIQNVGWIVVLSQPISEIYEYHYRNIKWTVIITCFIISITVLLGWNWVKHLLEPIHMLHSQVKIMGQGDLDHPIHIKSQDEIGDLGIAFNEMKNSLKVYISREVEMAIKLAHTKNLAILGTTYSKVTHEVGNLLNNISMALAAFKRESISPEGNKVLGILENESFRVREFIRNFLQFAKKPELNKEKRRSDLIIKQVVDILQEKANKKGINIEVNLPSDLPEVNIDASQIHIVINNLIKNSIEAITDSGTICIDGKIEEGSLVITIKDNGPGMRSDIVDQIFEPFFTTKGKQGTGLGLSIVKTAIEAHRGSVECQSETDKGTTFILRLPLE